MMKSAKETLAQYRLQGFSDELIELLIMEEENQELAEDLLNALLSDQEENTAEDTLKESTNNAEEDDILKSEELIKSAYKRSGMTDSSTEVTDEIESDNSEYIPPKLEIIEGGLEDADETIIPFIPEYALTEEEHEFAVARSLAFFGELEHEDEISVHYNTDEDDIEINASEDWYIDDVEVAEINDYEIADEFDEVEVLNIEIDEVDIVEENVIEIDFECIDFDSIGRSTPRENNIIDFEQAIIDLDDSRPAEKEWTLTKNPLEAELESMKTWAKNVEESIKQANQDKTSLETELNNRDETLVLQGEQMEQLREIQAGYIAQIANESKLLAKAESSLNAAREEADRTEHELLTFGNEIELLHGQLFTANSIASNQGKEILEKSATIKRLGDAYSALQQKNEANIQSAKTVQSEYNVAQESNNNTIAMLGREISDLQSQLESLNASRASQSSEFMAQNELINSLSTELSKVLIERDTAVQGAKSLEAINAKQERRIKRLERVRTKIKKLEFENNVLNTETVPNLQADKEDLVELASEEYNKSIMLDELAAKRSRRSSYATTLAAAACLMLVLMPILSWNNIETEKANIEGNYSMQLATAKATNIELEQELDTMQGQIELISNEFSKAKNDWNIRLSTLQQGNNEAQQGSQIIQAATGNGLDESQFNVVAFEDDLLTEPMNAQAGFDSEERYNGVSGLEEYQPQFAQAEATSSQLELIGDKHAKVRKGEGLSQVLWRVYRTSSPEMVSYISDLNKLKKDKRGQPMLKINQHLVLPKDVNTAMMNNKANKPNRM